MTEMLTSRGVVRTSADNLGVGLYSPDDQYRYWFITQVDATQRPGVISDAHADGLPQLGNGTLVWVGFNPSRSDDNGANRPSLQKVLGWAGREGFMEVLGVNLYAYRHTDPKEIRAGLRTGSLGQVIGEHTEEVLRHVAGATTHTLLAWGSYGLLAHRGAEVAGRFAQGQCVGICGNGEPFHPARKSRALQFMPYR